MKLLLPVTLPVVKLFLCLLDVNMMLREVFIQNLKAYRKEEKISQMKLAERCNTAPGYIGEIEMGRRFPSLELIEKIASALHIKPYLLFIDKSDMSIEHKTNDTREFLEELPNRVRTDITARLFNSLRNSIEETFDPKNY
jgi:transcriptional regulator with XRE-family HTH domain